MIPTILNNKRSINERLVKSTHNYTNIVANRKINETIDILAG